VITATRAEQPVYCKADSARLCLSCDRHVHSANPLSLRHPSTLLCDGCNLQPASVRCQDENLSLCPLLRLPPPLRKLQSAPCTSVTPSTPSQDAPLLPSLRCSGGARSGLWHRPPPEPQPPASSPSSASSSAACPPSRSPGKGVVHQPRWRTEMGLSRGATLYLLPHPRTSQCYSRGRLGGPSPCRRQEGEAAGSIGAGVARVRGPAAWMPLRGALSAGPPLSPEPGVCLEATAGATTLQAWRRRRLTPGRQGQKGGTPLVCQGTGLECWLGRRALRCCRR